MMYRYSDRLPWSAEENSFSRLIAQKHAAGDTLLDLTISNPTLALADYPHAEIASAYGAVSDFTYHADAFGTHQARQHIAAWYSERGVSVAPSQLALAASTSEAYSLLFKLLLNDGDEVLIPTPSYPLFEYLAKLDGVTLRPYRLLYDGSWHIDFESVEKNIGAKTRAIIVVNPNNPTGSFLKRAECERLETISLAHGLPLIADEVFMDYPFAESPDRVSTFIGRSRTLSFSLNGLSKSVGMPQMKLGWIAANGPEQDRARALQRLELLLDTYLSVATPVQNALGALLRIGTTISGQIKERLEVNRQAMNALTNGSDIHALHCEGGWSATLRVPAVLTEDTWITRLLREQSVIVQPGYFFDMPMDGCLLVSLLTAPDVFAEGLARLLKLTRW